MKLKYVTTVTVTVVTFLNIIECLTFDLKFVSCLFRIGFEVSVSVNKIYLVLKFLVMVDLDPFLALMGISDYYVIPETRTTFGNRSVE